MSKVKKALVIPFSLSYEKRKNRSRNKKNGNGNGHTKRSAFNKVLFEPLEPRVLLSSDLYAGTAVL